jgi:RNA polymerase sigma factor (sigma-70 family)
VVESQAVGKLEDETNSIERLYIRHIPAARVTAYLVTGDRSAAEDLAHEAFLRVTGRFRHLRSPEAFHSYLRRAVVNLSLNHLRKLRRERAYVESEQRERAKTVSLPDFAQQAQLWEALLDLPPRRRAALVLRFYEDLSEQQTAEVLQCSPSAVRSLVFHGMKALRERMKGARYD